MTLSLRRQALNFPHDDPDARWSIYCQGVSVGVIVLTKHRSEEPPTWDWVVHLHAGRFGNGLRHHASIDGREQTREAAMAAFRASWDILRPAVGDEGWAQHLTHMARINEQSARWARQKAGTEPGGYG